MECASLTFFQKPQGLWTDFVMWFPCKDVTLYAKTKFNLKNELSYGK